MKEAEGIMEGFKQDSKILKTNEEVYCIIFVYI